MIALQSTLELLITFGLEGKLGHFRCSNSPDMKKVIIIVLMLDFCSQSTISKRSVNILKYETR